MLVLVAIGLTNGKYLNIKITSSRILEHQKKDKSPEVSILVGFKKIIKNPAFLRMCFSITTLYFVVAAVQFWYSDYAITVMSQPKETVFALFSVVSITGPLIGVIVGGQVATRMGGYNHPNTIYLLAVLSIFAVTCSVPAAYIPP